MSGDKSDWSKFGLRYCLGRGKKPPNRSRSKSLTPLQWASFYALDSKLTRSWTACRSSVMRFLVEYIPPRATFLPRAGQRSEPSSGLVISAQNPAIHCRTLDCTLPRVAVILFDACCVVRISEHRGVDQLSSCNVPRTKRVPGLRFPPGVKVYNSLWLKWSAPADDFRTFLPMRDGCEPILQQFAA